MRKIISVLLVVLMLFSAVAVSASAANGECKCDDHRENDTCHCCIYCPENPSYAFVTPCYKKYYNGGYVLEEKTCCDDCSGFINNEGTCGCACECCTLNVDGTFGDQSDPIGGSWPDLWNEENQEEFVNGFQAILKRISDVFDAIFDAIFEFLRLDEVLGRN